MARTQDPVFFGRQPNDPFKPRVRLSRLTDGPAPIAPPAIDWCSAVSNWGMLGNDQVGDCTCAGAAHAIMASAFYGRHDTVTFTDSDALTMYKAISGYNGQPNTDVGATLQDALGYWRTTGIGGHKIVGFAQLDHTDIHLVQSCVALFGGVYTGFNVPQFAMDQFRAHKPWTLAKSGTQIVGGHCVPLLGYGPSGFTAVTWGDTQAVSLGFYKRYFDEVWVPLTEEWLSRTDRRSPTGLDTDALNADFLALTGEPGPFPASPAVSDAASVLHKIGDLVAAWEAAQS